MKKKKMKYAEILEILAPCGLNCRQCLSHVQGEIGRHSRELRRLLGSFDSYAARFSAFRPQFKNYPAFRELLELLAAPACRGCRSGECQNSQCRIGSCSRERGIDYCFQCADFPCDKSDDNASLKQCWLRMNGRLKEIGVDAYYEETKDQCRYV